MTEMANWRSITPHFRWHPMFYIHPQGRKFRKLLNKLHEFSGEVIAQRKKQSLSQIHEVTENSSDKKQRLSFLDLVLKTADDPSLVTDQDLRGLVDTFLFAVRNIII